jgi:hypothetical protein
MKEVGIDQETVKICYEYKRSALHASQGQRGLAVVMKPSIAAGGMERYCCFLLRKFSKCD